ncbi:MAG: site-specific integrase [Clostridiales bacterium]|nr:site-specific integrase [Clostridiales bacterium]
MPSYKQLSKGNWKVSISLGYKDGKKQIHRKQGFKTKKEAEIYATEILNKKNKGYVAPSGSSNIIFKDFIIKWFTEYKSKTIGINTYSRYKSSLDKYIIPNLGSYKLIELNNVIIQDFYNELICTGQKPSTAKKTLEVLNNCLKYAKNLKLIYNLPTDIEKIKIVKPIIEYWNEEELSYFLNQIKSHYLYKPVLISVLTGVRIGELCGIQWKDINFEKGTISINGQVLFNKNSKELIYTSILKTDTAYRIISIPKILIDYLKHIKDNICPADNDFVVLNRNGSMCTPKNLSENFSKVVCKYKKSIDEIIQEGKKVPSNYMQLKQISFHGLRHTHATLLILNGDNIKSVSERLGHKDITTTLNTYTHVMEEMKENTAALLQNIFTQIIQ